LANVRSWPMTALSPVRFDALCSDDGFVADISK